MYAVPSALPRDMRGNLPDQIEAARPGKPRGRRAGKLRSKRHRMKKVPKVTLSADSDRHTYEQKYGKQQRRWT